MKEVWVIEAAESDIHFPLFFHSISRGKCFLHWTDDFKVCKKFHKQEKALDWAKNNHLYCGYRIRSYPIQTKS